MNWSNSMCSDEYELRPLSRPAALLRTIGVAVSLVFASAAFGADEPGAPVPKPDVKVGDRWTYRITTHQTNVPRSTTSESRVTFVGPDVILTVETRSDGRETDSQFGSDWSGHSIGLLGQVFNPPVRFLKFPLQVGAEYLYAHELVAQRGSPARGRGEGTVKVMRWEDIEVPAGKFRALKVEAIGTFQRLDIRSSVWVRSVI